MTTSLVIKDNGQKKFILAKKSNEISRFTNLTDVIITPFGGESEFKELGIYDWHVEITNLKVGEMLDLGEFEDNDFENYFVMRVI